MVLEFILGCEFIRPKS